MVRNVINMAAKFTALPCGLKAVNFHPPKIERVNRRFADLAGGVEAVSSRRCPRPPRDRLGGARHPPG